MSDFQTIIDNTVAYHEMHGKKFSAQHYAYFFNAGKIGWWEKVGQRHELYVKGFNPSIDSCRAQCHV
jgi:hypothetical protein